jgi:hypothetical protein
MKTIKKETASTCQNAQVKTGLLTQNSIKNLFRFTSTTTQAVSSVNLQSSKSPYREEETSRLEAEAELRKAQARTYASTTLFR